MKNINTKEFYKDVIEWDIPNWSHSIKFWDRYLGKHLKVKDPLGIEIGARHGGMSLYLAKKYGMRMICTDYGGPSQTAHDKHRKYGVSDKIEYADVNALDIPYPDNTFDVVVFKSILGALGYVPDHQEIERQITGMNEFYRILKPGGVLLFAENMKASRLHQLMRAKFIPWGTKWRYITTEEMEQFLKPFHESEYRTYGFFGAFVRNPLLKRLLMPAEWLAHKILPGTSSYIIYGAAVK